MGGNATTWMEAEVVLAAGGDRRAFEVLVDATRSLVASIALSELRDPDVARDVAQDVYLQVWDDLRGLRNPGSFLPFLRQVTRQRARRVAGRRARELAGPDADARLAAAVDPAADPGARLLRAEQVALVREAMDGLPEDARETVALYYLEGHSTRQVAHLLGVSEPGVHQRLSRARAQLRRDLLGRLGDALGAAGPGAGFTAAVMAAVPSGASALGGAGSLGMASAATALGSKATVAGGAVVALVILGVLGGLSAGGPKGPGGTGGPSIARPLQPVTREPEAAPGPAEAVPVDGGLDVRVSSGGSPVDGAEVRVYRRLPLDPATGRPAWQASRTTRSGADGRVRVPATPGAWLVSARAPGFAPGQVEVVHPSGAPFTPVEVALAAPASLEGRVEASPAGTPVPLARISLERESELGSAAADLPLEERFGTAADVQGRFAVGGLSPGRYRLVAEAPGQARTVVRNVLVPRRTPVTVSMGSSGIIAGVVSLERGQPASGAVVSFLGGPEILTVTVGEGGGYSAEVQPGSYQVVATLGQATGAFPRLVPVAAGEEARSIDFRLGASSTITGRVTGAGGGPVAGALVLLSPAGTAGILSRTVTSADGAYDLGPLAAGEYDLVAHADGHSPARQDGLVLLSGQRFALDVRLDGVGSVSGMVRDESGAPVAGAVVSGGRMWGGPLGAVPARSVTGSDGRYQLDGLQVGVAGVRARRPGTALGDAQAVELAAGRRATLDFVLPGTGVLEGEVRMADGSRAAGDVAVRIGLDRRTMRMEDFARIEVGESGRYRAELPVGSYRALASPSGVPFMPPWAKASVSAGSTTTLDLVVRSAADDPGRIAVTVLEPGGAPAAGAVVRLIGPSTQGMMTAGETGVADVLRPPGPVTVSALRGGRVSPPVAVPPETREVVLELQPAAALRGKVVAPAGPPVNGFTLTIEPDPGDDPAGGSQGPWMSLGAADRWQFRGDRFELSDVRTGPLRILVTADDGRTGEARLSLAPGDAAERNLEVQAAGVVLVRPVDADGRPIEGAYVGFGARMIDTALDGVYYAGGGGQAGRFDRSGLPTGTIVVEDVPAGRQEIRVGAREHPEVVRTVDVPAGHVVNLGPVVLKRLVR